MKKKAPKTLMIDMVNALVVPSSQRTITQKDFTVTWVEVPVGDGYGLHSNGPILCIGLKGTVKLEISNSATLQLCERQFAFIRSGGADAVSLFSERSSACMLIQLSTQFLTRLNRNGWLTGLLEGRLHVLSRDPYLISDAMAKRVNVIAATPVGSEQSRLVQFNVQATVTDALRLMFVGKQKIKQRHPEYAAVIKIQRYTQEHFDEPSTSHEIARQAGVTNSALARQFKSVVGCSAAQYVVQLRTEKVKSLLEETSLPIKDISKQAGFKTTTDLHHVFKSATGTTPKQHRKLSAASG